MKFFTTPSSKNIIATLRIVTIEITELTFLLILYFHDQSQSKHSRQVLQRKLFSLKKNFMASFYEWGSPVSGIRVDSLLFIFKLPQVRISPTPKNEV